MRTKNLGFVTLPLLLIAACLLSAAAAPQGEGKRRRPPREPANLPGPQAEGFAPIKVAGKFEAIVDAKIVSAGEVTDQVNAEELVLGLVIDGKARAYPINMLTGPSREIINDELGGRHIAATW